MNATWNEVTAKWRAAQAALVEEFRPVYMAEVQRFAEELRPRFESGELRGWHDEDLDNPRRGLGPMEQLEQLCAERFGLRGAPRRGERDREADPVLADLVFAVSPSAAEFGEPRRPWEEAIAQVLRCRSDFMAMDVVARDVLAVAIARGWRKPMRGEARPERRTVRRWTEEVRP